MIGIGIKSLFWILTAGVLTVLTVANGSLNALQLESLNPALTLIVGFLAATLSGVMYRGFNLAQRSTTSIHIRKEGEREFGSYLFSAGSWNVYLIRDPSIYCFEFSPPTLRILVFIAFMLMGSLSFGFHELSLLGRVGQMHLLGKARYCPMPEAPQVEQTIRPECRLIYRAFELGYAKDLGKCAKNEDKKPEFCELQMPDEPDLHYSYRVLRRSIAGFFNDLKQQDTAKVQSELKASFEKFDPLLNDYLAKVNSEPQAAHVLMTNLPNPRGTVSNKLHTLSASQCREIYRDMPNKGPEIATMQDAGAAFQHALGHLLFDTSYPLTVARCEEFEILWNVPEEQCAEMQKNPEATIAKLGIEPRFSRVLEFIARKKQIQPKLKYRKSSEFLSVNCLTAGNGKPQARNEQISFSNQPVSFRWVTVPTATPTDLSQVDVFKAVARMLAPGFNYSHFQSKASFNTDPSKDVSAESMNGEGFDLSRLGNLRDADVFLGAPWLVSRADLMEIYPFHLHLRHFVESFRKHYRKARGRVQ